MLFQGFGNVAWYYPQFIQMDTEGLHNIHVSNMLLK